MNTKSRPWLSVIVRNKNSAETFAEVLKALFAQRFDGQMDQREAFELIVVDSGSRDASLEWLQAYPHRLVRIAPEAYFPGKVLNRAAALARGELLVFLNSDVVMLHDRVLAELAATFADRRVMAGYARQLPRPEADPWVRRDYAQAFPAQAPAPDWMTLSLPLAMMRREAWRQMPFYDWAWGSEDSEWGHRARQRGWQVAYVPEATVMHSHNYTLRQLAGRRFIEGEADAWMQRRAYPLARLPLRIFADSCRDACWALGAAQPFEALRALPRRLMFHWSHFRGWRHGWQRIRQGSSEASTGQQRVLGSHPAA